MALFDFPREPEPEGMEDEEDVEAYTSSAAEKHLERLDGEFVKQIETMKVRSGIALDVGTGPGSIPSMLSLRVPGLTIIGLDISLTMLGKAKEAIREAKVTERLFLVCADTRKLPFRDGTFDMVFSNSLLHHLPDPLPCLDEISRVAGADGAVIIRDLRRPSRLTYRLHVAYFGRRYTGRMKDLFEASVRSSFTHGEVKNLLSSSTLTGCSAIKWGSQYIVIARPPGRAVSPPGNRTLM
ncbi:MAG: class I SAM-dependent methyltransferase [Candidatus Glassbacteria bacterium]